MKLKKLALIVTCTLGLAALTSTADAYRHQGVWHGNNYRGNYNYRNGYYRGNNVYYRNNNVYYRNNGYYYNNKYYYRNVNRGSYWVPGHYSGRYWVPGQRVW